MMPGQHLYIVRHGETEWSASGRHTSVTDLPLTAEGRDKAARLAPRLTKVTFALVLTSPRERARQTCGLAGLGGHAKVDDRLVEWQYGDYEGLTSVEIQASAPGWNLFTDGCPGGESPEQVGARVDRLIVDIRSVPGDVAVFAHGHVSRVLMVRWIGLPVAAGSHFMLDTASLSILSNDRGVPTVSRWNDLTATEH
jgi:probable phosphoglycerate mutase